MANLKEVRNRIKSVSSTQQITKAMKMVSAAKLKRATNAIVQLRPYANKLKELLANLSASLEDGSSPFLEERERWGAEQFAEPVEDLPPALEEAVPPGCRAVSSREGGNVRRRNQTSLPLSYFCRCSCCCHCLCIDVSNPQPQPAPHPAQSSAATPPVQTCRAPDQRTNKPPA